MNRIEQILAFLKENPNDNFLVHALALEYIKEGNDEEAEKCFRKNIENNIAYIGTYYHLGKLMERQGETEEAIHIYQQGMEQAKKANDQHAYSELRSVYEELIY